MPGAWQAEFTMINAVTLLLTRFPHDEFFYDNAYKKDIFRDDVDNLSDDDRGLLYRTPGRGLDKPVNHKAMSGLWGTMLLLLGPKVTFASFHYADPTPLLAGERSESIDFNDRTLNLTLQGNPIAERKQYTTMERYRTDYGVVNADDLGYVRLMSQDQPYALSVEYHNSVVETLRPGHDGLCLRIAGGHTAQEKAILVHECPHPGYVIGCISPRPDGNRGIFENKEGNPSQKAMQEIVKYMGKTGNVGTLFVLRN